MLSISDAHARVLVEHAFDCNSYGPDRQPAEERFADVVADLAMTRQVARRDLLVKFLWQRVSLVVEGAPSRTGHRVWSAAVELLDQLGENLDDIFTGRPSERVLETRWEQR
jgi:hypothetical protein